MRNYQPQGVETEQERPNEKMPSRLEQGRYKIVLKECKDLIGALQQTNFNLQRSLREKEAIIGRLINQKQQYILHKINCKAQEYQKQIEVAQHKYEQMSICLKETNDKYQQIIEKYKKEIQRLTSYNRVLRIQNSSLRENEKGNNKKIGVITTTSRSKTNSNHNFSHSKGNQHLHRDTLEQTFSFNLKTPERVYSGATKSTVLPSTQQSYRQQSSAQITRTNRQKNRNIFTNQFLTDLNEYLPQKQHSIVDINSKLGGIQRMMKRVNELLANSDQQQQNL